MKMTMDQLAEYLRAYCPGRGRAVKGVVLQGIFHISGNELRRRVNRLRKKKVPIGSSPEGYFYAVTAAEVYTTIRQLRAMADGLNAAIRGLEDSLERFGEEVEDGKTEAKRAGADEERGRAGR